MAGKLFPFTYKDKNGVEKAVQIAAADKAAAEQTFKSFP